MRLYFSYADSPPDLEEFEILRSSYPTFNWSQAFVLNGGVLHEDLENSIGPDDIVVKNREIPTQGT
jgi:hypothetical protein